MHPPKYVKEEECRAKCGINRWLILTILGLLSLFATGAGLTWQSTVDATTECREATGTFREHQAAETERDGAMGGRLDRMEEANDKAFERIEESLKDIRSQL